MKEKFQDFLATLVTFFISLGIFALGFKNDWKEVMLLGLCMTCGIVLYAIKKVFGSIF